MPELPEVETVVRGLQGLVGKRIRKVDVRRPKLVSVGPGTLSPKRSHTASHARRFSAVLEGRKVQKITRRAKLVCIQLSGGWTLFIHLKMAGQLVVQKAKQRKLLIRLLNTPTSPLETLPTKHTHIICTFTDGTILYFNDIRLFGTWRVVHTQDHAAMEDLASYGPEPLGKGFTAKKLQQALGRRPRMLIKQALTDQQLLAGVGNIYADETLFVAKLLPTRTVGSLTPVDWSRLFRSVQKVLRHAIRTHGSSVGEFIRPDGSMGTFGRYHKVYGRKGEPCLVCKTPIRRIVVGGRGTHYCPKCQK